MTINGPPVVAKAGRTASNISRSGFRLVSSACRNATSSAITPTAVTPRMVRNDAGRHPIAEADRVRSLPDDEGFERRNRREDAVEILRAFPACQRLAERTGSVARSSGARTSE
jgi:hypothetical protein